MARKKISSLSLNQKIVLIIMLLGVVIACVGIPVTVISAFVSSHDWFAAPNNIQRVKSLGHVVDAVNKQPIPDAKVTFTLEGSSSYVYTDTEGVYLLEVAAGSDSIGEIRVDAPGYQTYTRHVTISPELGTSLDFRLVQSQTGTIMPVTPTDVPTNTPHPIFTLTPDNKVFAVISLNIYNVGLRKTPGYINKDITEDIIVEINSGQTVEILGESRNVDGLLWWKVSWNGYVGWIADHTGSGKQILIFN